MSPRTSRHQRLLCVLAIIVMTACGNSISISPTSTTGPRYAQSSRILSFGPMVMVRGGSPAQIDRLAMALERFAAAGLELPDVEVVFSGDSADCNGRLGVFRTGFDPWRISICSTIDSVYEHELAHAWERAALTDEVRASFMRLGGFTSWSNRDTPWNERGVEAVAVVIQQGLAGLPLAPSLGGKARRDLQLFELLTGIPAPRLVEWMVANQVACDNRPTTLSRITPDADGTVCSLTRERHISMRPTGGVEPSTQGP